MAGVGLAWEHALVLAWDGKPVPEGIDRALRALAIREGRGHIETPGSLVESKNGDCFILWSNGENLYYGKNQVPAYCSPDSLVIPWSEQHPPEDLRHALNVATVCAARLGSQLVLV